MNKKRAFRMSLLLVIIVATTVYFSRQLIGHTPIISRTTSRASWTSNAMAVDELVLESDLVVRGRVSQAPITRVIRHELSVFDENNKVVGSTVSEMLFSDTVFEIIKTYYGKPQSNITVMQTGGYDPAVSGSVEEMVDDPLYKVGEEYILFLVDISGDKVQAPNRELYRIVNPFGRYSVDGQKVYSYGQYTGIDTFSATLIINELEAQIKQAVSLLPTPIELSTETPTQSSDLTSTPNPESGETSTETPTETSIP